MELDRMNAGRTIFLLLRTLDGDETGRLPLDGVRAAAAGTAAGADLAGQMDEMCGRIGAALAREGVDTLADDLDMRIALSRALLAAGDDDIVIPLAVRERDQPPALVDTDSDGLTAGGVAEDGSSLDDLFDLNALDPEGWAAHAGEEQGDGASGRDSYV